MRKTNPNCDNTKCISDKGEVRVLPISGDSNIIVCKTCFMHEMKFRHERNKELAFACRFDIPKWESLEIYSPE